ncbi:hypothetical protein PUMCH_002678 [Australozyma saopauloensis]|uniref:Uncharacterized protein n=1 Tax=Australozyma saopauloensis TaxID=291208 RepID=A0AAX4HAE7_9ASCO|nr:hypothetical protein PUMCH_002678 [[Candida] saopauloensis]
MGVVPRLRSPDIEMQSTPESQSGSTLRVQEGKDAFNDPYSAERLTNVNINNCDLTFRAKIRLIVDNHFELSDYSKSIKLAHRLATRGLAAQLFTRFDEHQKWEDYMIKSMNKMKLGLRIAPPPESWVREIDILHHHITDILHDDNRYSLCPDLHNEFSDLLTRKLDACLREHLLQLKLLYTREYQGVWWRFYLKKTYAFPKLASVRQAVVSGQNIPVFVIVFCFFWLIFPKLIEGNTIQKTFGYISLCLFVIVTLLSFSTGRSAFYLWSFSSSVKPLYERAKPSIVWAEANWTSSKFGPEDTWCFWKDGADGFVPQVGPYTDVEYRVGKYV